MLVRVKASLVLALGAALIVGCGRVPLDDPVDSAGTGVIGGSGSGGKGATGGGGSAGTGAGGAVGPPPCRSLDETACKARLDCQAGTCGTCSGAQVFNVCLGLNDVAPCPELSCQSPCDALDEMTCYVRGDCKANFCPNCSGGQVFAGCAGLNDAVDCGPCPTPPPCPSLTQMECAARSDCKSAVCPDCMGGQKFTGCVATGSLWACPVSCPVLPPCNTLGEMECIGRMNCTAEYCSDCRGGKIFGGCVGPGEGFSCAACPAPIACASVADQLSCDARTDCHSVFGKCTNCPCPSAGCGVAFIGCAAGANASCMGTTTCHRTPPDCTSTNETTTYVVSYANGCYEGCVPPRECDSGPCPFPANVACFSGAVCASSPVQAVCVHGEWRCPAGASSTADPCGPHDGGGQ
jgi:hypothetical protein